MQSFVLCWKAGWGLGTLTTYSYQQTSTCCLLFMFRSSSKEIPLRVTVMGLPLSSTGPVCSDQVSEKIPALGDLKMKGNSSLCLGRITPGKLCHWNTEESCLDQQSTRYNTGLLGWWGNCKTRSGRVARRDALQVPFRTHTLLCILILGGGGGTCYLGDILPFPPPIWNPVVHYTNSVAQPTSICIKIESLCCSSLDSFQRIWSW